MQRSGHSARWSVVQAMKTFALIFSITLNVILGGLLLYVVLQGCAEVANGKIGVLSQDIKVGIFGSNKPLFTLKNSIGKTTQSLVENSHLEV